MVAVTEEAQEEGVSLSRDNLRAICDRRASYFKAKKGSHRPAAPIYAAYKQDGDVAKPLSNGGSFGVVREARRLPGDFADNLISICTEQRKLPRAEELLEVLTGMALEEIMPRLVTLAQDVTDTEAKKNLLKTRKAEIRAMLKEGGLATLREETKALQTELQQKGVIKKRGKGKPEDRPAVEADAEVEEAEEEPNEVQDNLDTALTYLDAALEADWPEHEYQAVLHSAQVCEQKLAEITTKAKELLADAHRPAKLALLDPSDESAYYPDE